MMDSVPSAWAATSPDQLNWFPQSTPGMESAIIG